MDGNLLLIVYAFHQMAAMDLNFIVIVGGDVEIISFLLSLTLEPKKLD
jgi:hypothetical protein